MIDLTGLYQATKDWTEPKVARVDPLDDIENEPVFQKLKSAGHELVWAREEKLRRLKREGWEPVAERDQIGRPTVFMDRLQELILLHRAPASNGD